ncbi:MAG: hypothetical protein ACT4P3_04680 [Betaproteobacteria bacterium]
MRRLLLLAACLALPADAQQAQRPLPEEVAFARLAPELQAMLGHLSPGEALRQVEFARQNLIALGQPNPSREQMRSTVQILISPSYAVSGSAGETPLPPLSPLVAPPPPVLGR